MKPSPENPARENRRRTRLVNPSFQWRYAALIAVTVFMASTILSLVLFVTLHHQARMRLINPETSSTSVAWLMLCFCAGLSALLSGIAAIGSLVLSHRICGPLSVLQRHFQALAQGRLPTVRPLRQADEFKDVMASFAQAVQALERRQQTAAALLAEALQNADQLVEEGLEPRSKLSGLRMTVDKARQQLEWVPAANLASSPAELPGKARLVGVSPC